MSSTKGKILVLGAAGQIGTDLVLSLREKHGNENVIASDIKEPISEVLDNGPFELIDVLNEERIDEIFLNYNISEVYHLAALLSATAEKLMDKAWHINMQGLLNILNVVKEKNHIKLFWPSSIAVFGPDTPKKNTPQHTITEPTTIYGITKLAGERLCEYYHDNHGVDVRSIRFPGLISYKAPPGGGTTDYAVSIFHEALKQEYYKCYLRSESTLPMMYMPDAIKSMVGIMSASPDQVKIRSSYNVSGMSFSPAEIALVIKKIIPGFTIEYQPDYRQKIADSWPQSIDDNRARADWGWLPDYSTDSMAAEMITELSKTIKKEASTL
ncbi:MAG: NAD-dependent epimerase/dehydratase family protein [Bacteroidia bacterium]|nr:NAD-dependent epimerase/dehydratase family protein [Bacteroidia bacterium]NNC86301.1 NAD-dependent epimerase/dehydratase family protein [Bacteroidia bacterium]NNM15331.1 NAD-dependent epimerase/dehydratase family protein [Bacteroidia bacterium]